jgi:hypothetical protein
MGAPDEKRIARLRKKFDAEAAPPHSRASEEHVLGSLMVENSAWRAAEELECEDFYLGHHQLIFAAIARLATAGKPFDADCVIEQLEREGKVEDAGGDAAVRKIAGETATAATIATYVEHVRERADLRRLQDIGPSIDRLIEQGLASAKIAEHIETLIAPRRAKPRELLPIELGAFLDRKLPAPAPVAGPLRAGSLGLVHARAGVGKTFLMLGLGVAVSRGVPILGFEVAAPRPVLYIDGEMLATDMQQRLAELVRPIDATIDHLWEPFHLITPDLQERGIPKIDTPEGQAEVLRLIDTLHPGVVFLDNLSCLTNPEDENRAESWTMVQELLLALRRRSVAGVAVHHSNREGNQRGTTRRTDILDFALKLSAVADPSNDGRTRIMVEFEKARGLTADQKQPFVACLEPHPAGGLAWSRGAPPQPVNDRVKQMLLDGMRPAEVAEELGANRSFCYRIEAQMLKAGELSRRVSRHRTSPDRQPVSPSPLIGGDSGDNTRASPPKKRGDKQETQETDGRTRAAGPDR